MSPQPRIVQSLSTWTHFTTKDSPSMTTRSSRDPAFPSDVEYGRRSVARANNASTSLVSDMAALTSALNVVRVGWQRREVDTAARAVSTRSPHGWWWRVGLYAGFCPGH